MRRTRITPATALLLLVLPVGCTKEVGSVMTAGGESFTSGIQGLSTRRYLDEPIAIDIAGPVGVDVESFGGDVTIVVNPEAAQGILTITRRAMHGYGRRDVADASLAEIAVAHEIVAGDLGPTLQVRATTTHDEPHFQRADIEIELPEVYGLRVRTTGGSVIARDVQGPVDVVTSGGVARVMTPWAIREPVTIVNNAGDVDLRLRGESCGSLDFRALRGSVRHIVRYGELVMHTGTNDATLLATFNGGTNPVVLRAADGDIRFAVVAKPTEVGKFVVD